FFLGTPVYVGTDGGIATRPTFFLDFQNINDGIATLLFRQIDIGRGDAISNAFTYGGMQDNAFAAQQPFLGLTLPFPLKPLEWYQPTVAQDGNAVAVDHSDPFRAYFTLNGGVNRTRDGGISWEFFGVVGTFTLAVDPNNGMIVYATSSAAGNFFQPGPQLFWSTDGGVTFVPIHTFPAPIQSIATVAIDSNTLWVGLTDGTVQRTANAVAGAGANWTPLTVTGAPSLPVGAVAIDPLNSHQAVVVYEGFSSPPNPTALTRHAFLTTDNGATWSDISGTAGGDPIENLPDLPLHSVVIDPDTSPHTIIVARNAGAMRTANLRG